MEELTVYKTAYITTFNSTVYGIVSRYWRRTKDGLVYEGSETVLLSPEDVQAQRRFEESVPFGRRAQAPVSEKEAATKKVKVPV